MCGGDVLSGASLPVKANNRIRQADPQKCPKRSWVSALVKEERMWRRNAVGAKGRSRGLLAVVAVSCGMLAFAVTKVFVRTSTKRKEAASCWDKPEHLAQ